MTGTHDETYSVSDDPVNKFGAVASIEICEDA